MMKRIGLVLAVAFMGVLGCSKQDIDGGSPTVEMRTLHIETNEIGGRTVFGDYDTTTGTYPTLWAEGDRIKMKLYADPDTENLNGELLYYDTAAKSYPTVVLHEGGKSASFTVEVPATLMGERYALLAMSPAARWVHGGDVAAGGLLRFNLPAEQTPTISSCDAAAQLIVARPAEMTELPESLSLQFKHLAAYGLLTLKNLDAVVSKVTISSSKIIAGSFYYHFDDGSIDTRTNTTGISSEITLTTSQRENIWFAALPADLSNTTLTLLVATNKGEYVQTIDLPAGRQFQSGRVAKFSVDFSGVEPTKTNELQFGEVWYENDEAVGLIYEVSENGQTGKAVSLKSMTNMQWASDTAVTGATDTDDGVANCATLSSFLTTNSGVTIPMLSIFCKQLGEGWYWPSKNELRALAVAYHGVEDYSSMTTGTCPSALPTVERNAQIAFDKLLTDAGGDALNPAADTADGTEYWASTEVAKTYTNRGWYVRLGSYKEGSSSKTNKKTGRAIKQVSIYEREEANLHKASWTTTTLREGVTWYKTETTMFQVPQRINIIAFEPSATNQVGIAYASNLALTSVLCKAYNGFAGINGGFFKSDSNAFVRIDGEVQDEGADLSGRTNSFLINFAGGALVINGAVPDIVCLTNGNAEAATLSDANVLVGGAVLVYDGEVQSLPNTPHNRTRDSRTAIGLTAGGKTMFFVTIDSADWGKAEGMLNSEVAMLMKMLGAEKALKFDGGGSTTMWSTGQGVLNRPDEGGYQRAVRSVVYVK